MVLTGRTGLVALICVLPIALSPWPATAFVVLLALLAVAVAVDVALAASTRRLRFTRSGDTAARLGQPVAAELTIENAGPPPVARPGPRRLAAQRAGRAAHPSLDMRCRATDSGGHLAAAGPPRRPAVGVGHRPLDRSARPGGPAELAPGAVADPDPAAVPVP